MKSATLLTAGLLSAQGRKRIKLISFFLAVLFTAQHSYAYCIEYKPPADGEKIAPPLLKVEIRSQNHLGGWVLGADHSFKRAGALCNRKIKKTPLSNIGKLFHQHFGDGTKIKIHLYLNEAKAKVLRDIYAHGGDHIIITPVSPTAVSVLIQNENGKTIQKIDNLEMNIRK